MYKDMKEEKVRGKKNVMNIKYKIMCKRLKGKEVIGVEYYNVLFVLVVRTEKDRWKVYQLGSRLEGMYMMDMHSWCINHGIEYYTIYSYKWEFSIMENLWNAYSYIRWQIEKFIIDRGRKCDIY